jgi:hypothetical protein
MQPKALAVIAVMAVFVLMYFAAPILFSGKGADREKLAALQQILADYQKLKGQRGSSEWTAFVEKTKQSAEPIVKALDKTASRDAPQRKFLLWAARDRLPTMLEHQGQAAELASKEFEGNLYDAAKWLGVAKGDPPEMSAAARSNSPPPASSD